MTTQTTTAAPFTVESWHGYLRRHGWIQHGSYQTEDEAFKAALKVRYRYKFPVVIYDQNRVIVWTFRPMLRSCLLHPFLLRS